MDGAVMENSISSGLPLAVVLIPIVGSALAALIGHRWEKGRDYLVLALTALVLLLSFYLFRLAWQDVVVSSFSVGFGDLPFNFRVDRLGAVFNLLSALIWFLATLFSLTYMSHEKRLTRYYTFYLLTLGGTLGVFLTADFFSLFLFFELMSLASYLLVIHTQTREAMSAGRLYLFLGVGGGLSILIAVLLIYHFTGTVTITPLMEKLALIPYRGLIAVLLIAGFGVKAGMVPLHIWLPQAHPVAPSPASALLSGIMIKAGAYGIIRVSTVLFTPAEGEGSLLWAFPEKMGYILIWFSILTMFSAAVMALFQSNAKRILAYSSVSQMGYILMGVGACAYLGFDGALAFGSFSMHIVNHAFFKAGMFMMIGAVFYRTGELELHRLGGLWRDFPVTAFAFLLAGLGIAGIPGFNGYTSKVLLHHAIVEAFEHHHLYSLYLAERLFMFTGALTTCYIARLFISVFLGQKPSHLAGIKKEPWNERVVFAIIGAAIIFIGTNPFYILEKFVAPLVAAFPFGPHSFEHLTYVNFWDIHDLQGVVAVVAIAALIYIAGTQTKFFNRKLPAFLSVEHLIYRPFIRLITLAYTGCGRALEITVDSAFINSPRLLVYFCLGGRMLEAAAEGIFVGSLGPLKQTTYRVSSLERSGLYFSRLFQILNAVLLWVYDWWLYLLQSFFKYSKEAVMAVFFFLFKMDYKPRGRLFMIINTTNFEYYLLVFFITLIIIMSLQLFR